MLTEAEHASSKGLFAAGFVAYEAAPAFDAALRVREEGPDENARLPLAWFGLFAEKRSAEPLSYPGALAPGLEGAHPPEWSCEINAEDHAAALEAIRAAIAAGDTYLVNYTTRFRRAWRNDDDPFALYLRLSAGQAGGSQAYLETEDWVVACASPELFFRLDLDEVTARPMKGTAPRGRFSAEDSQRAEELSSSPKERAENVMVVDLARNDLGRLAIPGTVAVPDLWGVERYPTVWQLTSTVTATLRPETGVTDLFGVLFPCGSVTGAPKVSTMGIIEELERSPRGVYCGAVGLIQPDRSASRGPRGVTARFAVAIRTAVVDKANRVAEYGSGGGITWDSSPTDEWAEVLVKASVLAGSVVSADLGLIETMGYEPLRAAGGDHGIGNLRGHLDRLRASAAYFGIPGAGGAENAIVHAVSKLATPTRVRLVLSHDGVVEVGTSVLEPAPSVLAAFGLSAQALCVDPEPVDSSEPTLFHKTTDRRRYDERARRHPHADDVILVNEREEVTETTRANLAVRLQGKWLTPAICCGLLPGVERARLLARGEIVEAVVTVAQLREAGAVATFSSLRGWRKAFVSFGACGPRTGHACAHTEDAEFTAHAMPGADTSPDMSPHPPSL